MRIDAHQHFWRIDRGDYGWLTPSLQPIYRDFLPEDLAPILERHGIGQTILVQAAPTEAETLFLLGLAVRTPHVAGVVGWIDFDAPDAPDRIAALAARPGLVGLRPMVQDLADDDWLLHPERGPALRTMAELGLVFDALVLPRHLPRLRKVLDRHPGLTVVVDHAAKPEIRAGVAALPGWAADLRAVAASPRAHCKLSGLVTEAAPGWSDGDLRPFVASVLDAFGAPRVLWGSDWPVVELAGGYGAWRAASDRLLATLTEDDRSWINGRTAARVYLRAAT
jgi:L-fuconolactonase